MIKVLESAGPMDGELEDEDDYYPSDEDVALALKDEESRSRAILQQEAERLKNVGAGALDAFSADGD